MRKIFLLLILALFASCTDQPQPTVEKSDSPQQFDAALAEKLGANVE